MATKSVHDYAAAFVSRWAQTAKRVPALILDGTWPSVGIVDSIVYNLRGQKEYGQIENMLVKCCASYLSLMTQECWSTFGVESEVSDSESGICIETTGGERASGTPTKILVELHLRQILQNLPRPFPVLGEFARDISNEQSLVTPFALGLVTGLSPFAEGGWTTESPDTFQEPIRKVAKLLASSCANYYSRVFPNEQLGQVAELYLEKVIYPPMLMEEDQPAIKAVDALLEFFREYQVNTQSMTRIARNLALSPDETIATCGFAISTALLEEAPDPQLVALAESRGTHVGLLRPTMIHVREKLGLKPDWLISGEMDAEDEKRFEIEALLGFIPWAKLSLKRVRRKNKEPYLLSLLNALSVFDIDEANNILRKSLAESPGDIEMHIQSLYLQMVGGELEKTTSDIRKLLGEPGAESEPLIYNLWGLCDLALGKSDDAVARFGQAYQVARREDQMVFHQVSNNLAWTLILTQDFDRALDVLNTPLEGSPCPITGLLNKAFVLRMKDRLEEAQAVQDRLLELYPLDRRVFGNLMIEASKD